MVVSRFVAALVVVGAFALAPGLVAGETCTSLEFDVDDDSTTTKIPATCTVLKLDEQGITDDMAAAIATALLAAPAQFNAVSLAVRT